jgi:hypothetical protein
MLAPNNDQARSRRSRYAFATLSLVGFAPTPRIKRWYSQKPAAIRKRKSRAGFKQDIQVFNIRLSRKMVEEAVRIRERLPPGTKLSKHQLEKALAGGFEWWADLWKMSPA